MCYYFKMCYCLEIFRFFTFATSLVRFCHKKHFSLLEISIILLMKFLNIKNFPFISKYPLSKTSPLFQFALVIKKHWRVVYVVGGCKIIFYAISF